MTPTHCPMCQEQLMCSEINGDMTCPTKIYMGGQHAYVFHYQWHNVNQYCCWIIPPFRVIPWRGKTNIWIANQSIEYAEFAQPVWKLAFHNFPGEIHPSPDYGKLLHRLQTIITFS